MKKKKVRIGSRGSRLAVFQAKRVQEELLRHYPELEIEIENIKTEWDERLDVPLPKFGGKGVFTKTIEDALLNGSIDLAVHSTKDMPTVLPEGLGLLAVLERENPSDCLITLNGEKLSDLPAGARLGTSSVRRIAQLKRYSPQFQVLDCRGNVETRLRKLEDDQFDGLMMAYSGVKRLELEHKVSQILDRSFFIPACGQGIIGIEGRVDDEEIIQLCSTINHSESEIQADAERTFLFVLEGGCQIPCGVTSRLRTANFTFRPVFGLWMAAKKF
jgi:hydroxymethylbilane synthase